mgnify:FL=1
MIKKILTGTAVISVVLTGCGNKPNNSQLSEPSESSESETMEISSEITEEIPTERIREIESIENFEYEILDGKATVTKYTGTSVNVEIPDKIDGMPVTKIGFYSFEAKYGIESVTLPETVEFICEGAFMDCASMKTINIPEAVTGIERSAFAACTSLESLVIPQNTNFIQMEAFTACDSMTSLTINNPDLEYEDWGLEELPNLTIYASENSVVYKWAAEKDFNIQPV